MSETDFILGDLKYNWVSFFTILDSNGVSTGKIIEILSDFVKQWPKTLNNRFAQTSKITFKYACNKP